VDADVICETRTLMRTVIPAKAGIHSASHWKYAAEGLDSCSPAFAEDRLRGNDWRFASLPVGFIPQARDYSQHPPSGQFAIRQPSDFNCRMSAIEYNHGLINSGEKA